MLLRRLASHYPDAVIAGVLNRQGRRTAYGHRFDAMDTLGLSRQSLLQRIKYGKLETVHVVRGQRKGLWIKRIDHAPTLFEHTA